MSTANAALRGLWLEVKRTMVRMKRKSQKHARTGPRKGRQDPWVSIPIIASLLLMFSITLMFIRRSIGRIGAAFSKAGRRDAYPAIGGGFAAKARQRVPPVRPMRKSGSGPGSRREPIGARWTNRLDAINLWRWIYGFQQSTFDIRRPTSQGSAFWPGGDALVVSDAVRMGFPPGFIRGGFDPRPGGLAGWPVDAPARRWSVAAAIIANRGV